MPVQISRSSATILVNARTCPKPVVSKNTNELKTGAPDGFGLKVSTLRRAIAEFIHHHRHPVLCQNSALLK